MIIKAVFLLSLSSIAFEILLTRVFSICQWNHLSFMVISIALFGFAASGTFLSIIETRTKGLGKQFSSRSSVTISITLYSITTIASFMILNLIPLDYFRLPLEPIQMLYLLIVFILLAFPFFFTGLVISVAYSFIPEKTGQVYFASMAGSACGAIIPPLFLSLLGEGRLIILAALIPLIPALPGIFGKGSDPAERDARIERFSRLKKILIPTTGFGILFVAIFLVVFSSRSVLEVKLSPYKALSQVLQFPDTRIVERVNSMRGRLDSVKSPYIRFAPGLSLKYTEALPGQSAIFTDGDDQFVLYKLLSQNENRFSRFTLAFAGYLLVPNPEDVLLIQHGGGLAIPCAVASGAKKITIIAQNPGIARIIRSHYNIPVVNQNPRSYLAQTDKRFQIIQVENWGTSLPGSAALNQEHLFTTEAFAEYFNHLTEAGVIIISRKLLLPPSDSVRLWATAYESLRSLGIESPECHIAMLRDWGVFTLIVSKKPFRNTTVIKEFARNRNFDMVYIRGITQEAVNRFNIFDEPYHFIAINRLAQAYQSGGEKGFFKDYILDVVPQSDSRPFPSRFLKWSKLKDLYKSTGTRLYYLLMSGEIIVAVVFIEALVVAVILLVLPLLAIPKKGKKASIYQIIYFLSVGAGFIFVELFFIKKYTLLFGDPVISFTVVLCGILVFSGIGGYYSQRVGSRGLRNALITLIIVLILILFVLDIFTYRILRLPGILQYILAFILLFPCGFMMGFPFPIGMQYLLQSPVQRAYAWTANGCASVLTSIIAAQIALSMGVPLIMACASFAYILALFCHKRC